MPEITNNETPSQMKAAASAENQLYNKVPVQLSGVLQALLFTESVRVGNWSPVF